MVATDHPQLQDDSRPMSADATWVPSRLLPMTGLVGAYACRFDAERTPQLARAAARRLVDGQRPPVLQSDEPLLLNLHLVIDRLALRRDDRQRVILPSDLGEDRVAERTSQRLFDLSALVKPLCTDDQAGDELRQHAAWTEQRKKCVPCTADFCLQPVAAVVVGSNGFIGVCGWPRRCAPWQ